MIPVRNLHYWASYWRNQSALPFPEHLLADGITPERWKENCLSTAEQMERAAALREMDSTENTWTGVVDRAVAILIERRKACSNDIEADARAVIREVLSSLRQPPMKARLAGAKKHGGYLSIKSAERRDAWDQSLEIFGATLSGVSVDA